MTVKQRARRHATAVAHSMRLDDRREAAEVRASDLRRAAKERRACGRAPDRIVRGVGLLVAAG